MSSTVVFSNGNKTVTVAANESVAVYCKGKCQVFRRFTYPQYPSQDSLLGTVSNGETIFGPYTGGATLVIAPGATNALYEVGIAPRVMESTSRWVTNGAPNVLNSSGALTAAMILGGILTSTTGAGVAGTVPTGTVMDAAADFEIGDKVLWSVINTGGNTFTVTTDTDHTLVGTMAVTTATSGLFETRKTAAATYITYRLS